MPVRNEPSTSSGSPDLRASSIQRSAFFFFWENAALGPRTLPFQDAGGVDVPSEALATLRFEPG